MKTNTRTFMLSIFCCLAGMLSGCATKLPSYSAWKIVLPPFKFSEFDLPSYNCKLTNNLTIHIYESQMDYSCCRNLSHDHGRGGVLFRCESVKQAYPGPLSHEIGSPLLRIIFSKPRIYIDAIECDGEKINEKNQGGITLLPGKHTITYNAIGIVGVQGFQEIARGSTEVSVEAGGIYLATGHMTTRAQVDVKQSVLRPDIYL